MRGWRRVPGRQGDWWRRDRSYKCVNRSQTVAPRQQRLGAAGFQQAIQPGAVSRGQSSQQGVEDGGIGQVAQRGYRSPHVGRQQPQGVREHDEHALGPVYVGARPSEGGLKRRELSGISSSLDLL